MSTYDGPERRVNSTDNELWNLLRSIDKKLDIHLEEEAKTRPKLEELISLLEMSKGAVLLIKTLVLILTPIGGLVYWVKEHVKL